VGYGDISPITPLGQIFGAITAIIGIGIVALPSGILASGFIGAFEEEKEEGERCPHCGQEVSQS
jgi:voltage-gated potassium channel